MSKIIKNNWSIRVTVSIFFFAFIIANTSTYFLTHSSFTSLEKYQIVLDQVGRNRELVEQIVIYCNQLADPQASTKLKSRRQTLKNTLAGDITRFDENLQKLINGDELFIEDQKVIIPTVPEAEKDLRNIEKVWDDEFSLAAQDFYMLNLFQINGDNRVRTDRAQQALEIIQDSERKLVNYHNQLIDTYTRLFVNEKNQTDKNLQIFLVINIALIALFFIVMQLWLMRPLSQISRVAERIGTGDLTQKINYESRNEVGYVAAAINEMVDKIRNATNFIKSIEKGNLSVSYTGLNGISVDKDTLAGALLNMREKMKAVALEEEARNWSTKGLARFGQILQTYNDDTEKLSYEIISNVVKYLDANQGGLFIVNDDNEEDIHLDLIACYAFNKRKFIQRTVGVGEGLVGQSFKDADTIYITDIPENYVDITSGLGGAQPKSVLVVPLKLNEQVYGAIELASFEEFKEYEVDFLEKLSENIASNLYAARANEKTKRLLIESNNITEQMRSQELTLRRNLEVLEDTKQQMQKNQEALAAQSFAIKSTLITVEMNMDREILSANDLFLKATKYSSDELMGQTHRILIPPSQVDKNQYEKLWRDLKAGRPHSGEYKRVAKDGSEIWLRATYSPIKDNLGMPYKILKLAFDVTEDKRLRLDFKEQLDSFKRSSAVVEFDLEGKIIDTNDNFLDLMEYSRDEIIGQDHTVIVPDEEKHAKSYRALWHKLKQGSYHIGEVKRITKSGKTVWFQGSFNPILDLNGRPYKIIEFIIDITDRKIAERRMFSTQEELQAKEANLTALINNTDDAIYTIGPNYRMTLLNESARRFYEKLGASVRISSSVLDVLPSNYYYIWKNYYDRALNGEKFSVEQPIFSDKTSQKFYLSVYFNPIIDDQEKVTGVAIFARDITNRKERELDIAEFAKKQATRTTRIIENQKQALQRATKEFESEKLLLKDRILKKEQEIIKVSNELTFTKYIDSLVIAIDQEYEVSYYNTKARDIYLDWHLYLQPGYFFPDTFPQNRYSDWKSICDRVLEGKTFHFHKVFPNHYEKQPRIFVISCYPVKNEKHEVTHAVISAQDVTKLAQGIKAHELKNKKRLINIYKAIIAEKSSQSITTSPKKDLLLETYLPPYDPSTQIVEFPKELSFHIDREYAVKDPSVELKNIFALWDFYLQPDFYIPDAFPQSKFDEWKTYFEQALKGEEVSFEDVFINRKLRKIFFLKISLSPIYDEDQVLKTVLVKVENQNHLRKKSKK